MTDARAIITTDFVVNGISVLLGRRTPGGNVEMITFDQNGWMIGHITPSGEVREVIQTFRLSDDLARALLDALLEHYRLSNADLRLRHDYEAERKRVDKLTDALIGQLRAAP